MEDVRASQHISGAPPGDSRGRAAAHDAQLMRAAAASTAATMATLSLPRRDNICSPHPCRIFVVFQLHHLSCRVMSTPQSESGRLHRTRSNTQQ
jgi:hypothetical protein